MAKAGSVSLIIPGLFEPFDGIDERAFPELPALSVLLGRSDRIGIPPKTSDESLLYSLVYPEEGSVSELPSASLRWLNDFGQLPTSMVLCADPVYLRPDKTELRLFGLDQVRHDKGHLAELLDYLNSEYTNDSFSIVEGENNHWYLSLENLIDVNTVPLSISLGQDVTTILPRGTDSAWLKNLFNEIQMQLHNYAHRNKQMGKQYGPNSVWFHGAGQLPESKPVKQLQLFANDPFSKGLAAYASLKNKNCPASVSALEIKPDVDNVVILDVLQASASYGNFNEWVSEVTRLEEAWFAPLLSMLKKRQIITLTLYDKTVYKYIISYSNILKLWRKSKALSNVSRGLS